MAIATEITNLVNNLKNAYNSCEAKGASLPANKNFDNLSSTIDSIDLKNNYQIKTINPNETKQDITADSNYDALSKVTINAISSTYVGTGITRQAAKTVTPSTVEQTAVNSGVYTTGIVKVAAMPSGALSTPTINTSTGVVTAKVGTAGYMDTTTTKTLSLTTQAAKTVTPTKSSQTAVAAQRYTTGVVTVAAIPDEYITTTDATATQSDIISGQTAYVKGSKVTGNLVVQKYYTGSSAPSSTLGNDGDIYLQS